MFTEIPSRRPDTPLLDSVDKPAELRALLPEQLPQLARELREFLLYTVGKTGGHLGAGLGTVELAIALHYVYNTPEDALVWDVGHQAYPHKILTGRRDRMNSLRGRDGVAGFLKRSESPCDSFGAGHSSTSISAALGMALGRQARGDRSRVAAIIGDGGMTAGMAFEALAHTGHTRPDMLVVLNDNQMSISRNIGGLHNYLSRIWASGLYSSLRERSKQLLDHVPPARELVRRTEEHAKGMVSPGTLFEELGLNYVGPMDGHDLPQLVQTLSKLRERNGPQLLHLSTVKGKGYQQAENDPIGFHAIAKLDRSGSAAKKSPVTPPAPKYQQVFGDWLCECAERDDRLVAITPAMCEGSGMVEFAQRFPHRFYDVAIAEQHAITFAGGLACEGMKPVVAIYSTFLQRGYDQLIHDIALQGLDLLLAIDRAGLVGEDGPTHHGAFDLSFLRCIPNLVIMTPTDADECRQLLETGFRHPGAAAVRYPRGAAPAPATAGPAEPLEIGKGFLRRRGKNSALLVFGAPLKIALEAAEQTDASVADMRFVKPLDEALICELARSHRQLISIEDNALAGGAGSAVLECLQRHGISTPLERFGIPDRFIEHGSRAEQLTDCGISAAALIDCMDRA